GSDLLRLPQARERRPAVTERDEPIEDLGLLPPELELGIGDRRLANVVVEIFYHHQAARLRIRQRADQERVHYAENGGGGPRVDGQSQHGYQREAGVFLKHAQRKTNVLDQSFHTTPFIAV